MPITDIFSNSPIIASVKDPESLDAAIASDCNVVFILYGSICNIGRIVQRIKAAGKHAFIHIDLLEGASNQEVVVEFLKIVTHADGIISTKSHMIKAAKAHGFYTILRLFLIDSISYFNAQKQMMNCQPDSIEVMPGVMPVVIQWIRAKSPIPIIAGGLICDEETANIALDAGVNAISTTNRDVWAMATPTSISSGSSLAAGYNAKPCGKTSVYMKGRTPQQA
ncbi:glycerol-3-phosphate responsive antiterminator [Photobacterium aphoticum]|uniref:glycerol-3-phosphate responsive antiterminator n=1 Tax=Photobacterium aphoticum TaxID=754436 RepID=UPI0009E529D4|nr:glycerol-3-phosphate responsive antiterminator [Photobacterium aphoticum]PSU59325.1 glycerol-3-phosphate responsive antiterminator [Photobacterium aphoticum]GHA32021.1 glycerol uptake operon antiterminator [Photobacterium aphoticum]